VKIELEHDVGAVSFGGVDADAEDGGDFLVAFTFGEKLEDFAFARGKSGTVRLGGGVTRFGGGGDAKGEVRLLVAEGVNGGEEDAVSVVFKDIAAGTGFNDLANEFIGFVHGEDQDLGAGRGFMNSAGGIHAVEKGHADIENGDIGLQFGGFFDGIAAINGFGADMPAIAGFEEGAEASANDGVVIRDQDAKGGHQEPPWEGVGQKR